MKTPTMTNPFARTAAVAAALACTFAGAATADVVTPNSYTTATDAGSNNNSPLQTQDRTYQLVIAASEFTGLSIGAQITGLQWRADTIGTTGTQTLPWPPAGQTDFYPSYDIYLSSALTTPATMSSTFALNEGADRVLVRSGPYTIPTLAYPNNGVSGATNPWGLPITFTTPFVYNGGGLTLTIRHTAQSPPTGLYLLDAITSTGTNPDWGTKVSGRGSSGTNGTNYAATTGTNTGFCVTQFLVAAPTGACCTGSSCSITTLAACPDGSAYQGNNTTCTPTDPCAPVLGACCNGTTCSVGTQAACTGSYKGDNSTCQAPGNPTTCCPANSDGVGGVNVQDIFTFLGYWFNNDPRADFNHSSTVDVQDIFSFLGAWFVGC